MVTCDQQEKVSSSEKVLLWIFLPIRNLIWRYAELIRLSVGSGLIPLNIKIQQDNRTVCCAHKIVTWTHDIELDTWYEKDSWYGLKLVV